MKRLALLAGMTVALAAPAHAATPKASLDYAQSWIDLIDRFESLEMGDSAGATVAQGLDLAYEVTDLTWGAGLDLAIALSDDPEAKAAITEARQAWDTVFGLLGVDVDHGVQAKQKKKGRKGKKKTGTHVVTASR